MFKRIIAITLAAQVTCFCLTLALSAQPRLIPRSEHIDQPIEKVYRTFKDYFADQSRSLFKLRTANDTTHILVATRSGIDDATWRKWAFCRTNSMEAMIYQLRDGSVTVTVQLQPSGNAATFTNITADFEGDYGLGANEQKIACTSKGALEHELLGIAAGAAPKKPT